MATKTTSSGTTGNITVSSNVSYYYSNLAKSWATKTGSTVDGEEYSSKYYAQISQAAAETATTAISNISEAETTALTNISTAEETAVTAVEEVNSELETLRTTAISNISDAETTAITAVETAQSTAVTAIETEYTSDSEALQDLYDTASEDITAKHTAAVNDIETAQTTAITAIDTRKATAVAEVTETYTTAMETIETQVDNAQIWAEGTDEEVAALGGEHSAKVWAEECSEGMNVGMTNLSDEGINKLEAQKMYETGNVLTDEQGYNQLAGMASSTFDGSKLTIVGEPTITEYGIASNFSLSDYVLVEEAPEISSTDSFYFRCKSYCVNNDVDDKYQPLFDTTTAFSALSNDDTKFVLNRYGTNIIIRINDAEGNLLYSNGGVAATGGAFSSNSEHEFIVDYKNGTLNAYVDDTLLYTSETDLSTTYWGTEFVIGSGSGLQIQYGTIDLPSYELRINGTTYISYNKTGVDTVEIDGESVEIPYTLSSTGSKIVDVAYRETVQALYEQEGQALYYTIDRDNQNFTLPMGEVYGMITNVQKNTADIDLSRYYTSEEIDTMLGDIETILDEIIGE